MPRKIIRSLPPVALLITTVIWGGCSSGVFSSLEDLCARHTVLEPEPTVVTYPSFEGQWLPTIREIWTMERKLQHYFSKPTMELGNADYSGRPPAQPSGFNIADYFVSYDFYEENGQRFIEATGYLQTDEHAKAWFENEVGENTPTDRNSEEERVIPLRPFGGGYSIFDAVYNVDTRKLLKFYYGAPL